VSKKRGKLAVIKSTRIVERMPPNFDGRSVLVVIALAATSASAHALTLETQFSPLFSNDQLNGCSFEFQGVRSHRAAQ